MSNPVGIRPSPCTFPRLITTAKVSAALHLGVSLHCLAIKLGYYPQTRCVPPPFPRQALRQSLHCRQATPEPNLEIRGSIQCLLTGERNKQFAMVENPGFWNWTFTLKDEEKNVLAQIDRDWRGLGLELFTDAGQYVIRFGDPDPSPKFGMTSVISELEVTRPLTLTERAVAVALAVSLDTDYFSRRGGWGLPILIVGE
ncbi:hypothetical protein J5N97_016649 [Dioscorea zingiberensis]|uniref:Phospholipid scramblase n=1 Tax=Dioscorea zingiberensis TaxID=325984 RepID=A0A9D5CKN1_9LILI|nr:hypothetical protein J5N97_016649 [Dioscorea zingiberensis]